MLDDTRNQEERNRDERYRENMNRENRNQDERTRENMNRDTRNQDERTRENMNWENTNKDDDRYQEFKKKDIRNQDTRTQQYKNQDNRTDKVLYYLDELSGYKVASDYEDVRGWEVVDNSNRTIGEVDDLLVNKNTERVVYLDVEIDDKIQKQVGEANDRPVTQGTHTFVNEEGENHLIIPVGTVDIDEDNKKVYARDIEFARFLQAKWFRKGSNIDRNYEMETLKTYYPESSWDENERNDDRFYDRREFRHGRI